jgi:hypothetical protein
MKIKMFAILDKAKPHTENKFEAEGGYNTSTVTLRAVRGDVRGTQCLGV